MSYRKNGHSKSYWNTIYPLLLISNPYYGAVMQSLSLSNRSLALGVISTAAGLISVFAPTLASAQSTSVQTAELLPPGQNMCQTMTVTDIEPHVYGGELESFDVTLSTDVSHSYVAVLAQIGNTAVPLNFITRWAGSPSGTRIHVDTMDTPVENGLPINLTLLASLPGQPTCVTSITFDATDASNVAPNIPSASVPSQGNTSGSLPTSAPSTGSGGVVTKGGTGSNTSTGTLSSSSSIKIGSTTAVASVLSSGTFPHDICVGGNAYRLWFILLAIYVVIVAIVVFAEPWFLEDSVLGSTASILVPLILLLSFWYFSEACRAASWIPVLACITAIIGLFLAFREYETPPLLAAASSDR